MSKAPVDKMTKHDLDMLLQLDRNEAKALKAATEARRAQVIAQGEADIARRYTIDHRPEWEKAYQEAQAIIDKLNKRIAADVEEEGSRAEFAPSAEICWLSRGENVLKDRRAELRRVLESEAMAQREAACAAIDLYSVKAQRELLMCGLDTEIAKQILAQRPKLEAVMPMLRLGDLEKKLDASQLAESDDPYLKYGRRRRR